MRRQRATNSAKASIQSSSCSKGQQERIGCLESIRPIGGGPRVEPDESIQHAHQLRHERPGSADHQEVRELDQQQVEQQQMQKCNSELVLV